MLFLIRNKPKKLLARYLKSNNINLKQEIISILINLDATNEIEFIFENNKLNLAMNNYLFKKYKLDQNKLAYLFDSNLKKEVIINQLIDINGETQLLNFFNCGNYDILIQNYLFNKYINNHEKLYWLYSSFQEKNKIIDALTKLDSEKYILKIFESESENASIQSYLFNKYINNPEKLYWLYNSFQEKNKIIDALVKLDSEEYILKLFESESENASIQSYLFNKYINNPEKLYWLYNSFQKKNKIIDALAKLDSEEYILKIFESESENASIQSYIISRYDNNKKKLTSLFINTEYLSQKIIILDKILKTTQNSFPEDINLIQLFISWSKNQEQNLSTIGSIVVYVQFLNIFSKPQIIHSFFIDNYQSIFNNAIKPNLIIILKILCFIDSFKFKSTISNIKNNYDIVIDNKIYLVEEKINNSYSLLISQNDNEEVICRLLNERDMKIGKLLPKFSIDILYEIEKEYCSQFFDASMQNKKNTPNKFDEVSYKMTILNELKSEIEIVKNTLKNRISHAKTLDEVIKFKNQATKKLNQLVNKKDYIESISLLNPINLDNEKFINELGQILINTKDIKVKKGIIELSELSTQTLWIHYISKIEKNEKLFPSIINTITNKITHWSIEFLLSLSLSLYVKKNINLLKQFGGHEGAVNSISFSMDGTKLVSGSDDYSIKLWDIESYNLINTLKEKYNFPNSDKEKCHGKVDSVTFSPDDKTIVSCCGDLPHPGTVHANIKFWDVIENKVTQRIGWWSNSAKYSPNGKFLVAGGKNLFTQAPIYVCDAENNKLLYSYDGSGIGNVAFSSNSKLLVSASEFNRINIWNLENGTEHRTLKGLYREEFYAFTFSPDNKLLYAGGAHHRITIFDIDTGNMLKYLEGHNGKINSLLFIPEDDILVSASDDGNLGFWDKSNDYKPIFSQVHNFPIKSICFTDKKKILATCSEDESIKLWDISGLLLSKHIKLTFLSYFVELLVDKKKENKIFSTELYNERHNIPLSLRNIVESIFDKFNKAN